METKQDVTDKQIKVNSSKIVEQIVALDQSIHRLENKITKEKAVRTVDTARIEAEVSELKSKIRQSCVGTHDV